LIRRRLEGPEAIEEAMDRGASIAIVLCRRGGITAAAQGVVDRLRAEGVPIREEDEREMRRMSACSPPAELLGLEGLRPESDLDRLMEREGPVFLLSGLRYPGNVGYILRCAEVAGAAGVVIDGEWGSDRREEALRIGMRVERFFSVLEAGTERALAAGRRAGRRIVAVETGEGRAPWEVGLDRPVLLLFGSEAEGIPEEALAVADDTLSIPMRGFVPSYNVQAAVGIVLGEWIRQNGSHGPGRSARGAPGSE